MQVKTKQEVMEPAVFIANGQEWLNTWALIGVPHPHNIFTEKLDSDLAEPNYCQSPLSLKFSDFLFSLFC